MNKSILLALAFFIGVSCDQNKENEEDTFCTCFQASKIDDFEIRCNDCLSKHSDEEHAMDTLTENIKSCRSFFNAIVPFQEEMIHKGAENGVNNFASKDSTSIIDKYNYRLDKCITRRDFDSVIYYAKTLEKLTPEDLTIPFVKGYAYEQLGKYSKAMKEYTRLKNQSVDGRYEVSTAILEAKQLYNR